MKKIIIFTLLIFAISIVYSDNKNIPTKSQIVNQYKNQKPLWLSAWKKGIIKKFRTKKRIIALTFDACGGLYGNGFDWRIFDYLKRKKIPATFFLAGRWVLKNKNIVKSIDAIPYFDIQNHGYLHKPLSVRGWSRYGIKGTLSVGEVYDEVMKNDSLIFSLISKKPIYFRAGTAYYDNVSIKILYSLGYYPVNFSIPAGDYDITIPVKKIVWNVLSTARPGGICLMHVNQPKSNTYASLKIIVKNLKKRGYSFVLLKDYKNYLQD